MMQTKSEHCLTDKLTCQIDEENTFAVCCGMQVLTFAEAVCVQLILGDAVKLVEGIMCQGYRVRSWLKWNGCQGCRQVRALSD